jgi:hypothetical protein
MLLHDDHLFILLLRLFKLALVRDELFFTLRARDVSADVSQDFSLCFPLALNLRINLGDILFELLHGLLVLSVRLESGIIDVCPDKSLELEVEVFSLCSKLKVIWCFFVSGTF